MSATEADTAARAPLAIFIPSFGEGGVDRMLVNIASGIAGRGFAVDFIVNRPDGPYLRDLDPRVRRLTFRSRDDTGLAEELLAYLRRERPQVVLTGKDRDGAIALRVRDRLPDTRPRFVLRAGTAVGSRTRAKMLLPWQRRRYLQRLRALHARADAVLANAEAVADEISEAAGIPRDHVRLVPNPTVTPTLHDSAAREPDHPWLREGTVPVILGIGGLRRQKDFGTLIRAFAQLRRERTCRLVILGSGRRRARLQRLARRLGVADDVSLPGFSDNPYAALARASLFVLSSRWEGLPNVLIEALAVGTPVVATDCPGGAREILRDGRLGPLVPVADWRALAAAMARVLDDPPARDELRAGARRYTLETATEAYIRALELRRPEPVAG